MVMPGNIAQEELTDYPPLTENIKYVVVSGRKLVDKLGFKY